MRNKNTIRVTVDLTGLSNERLERLVDLVEANSKAEIIRDALRLYEWAVNKYAEGADFYAENADGVAERVVLLGAETAVAHPRKVRHADEIEASESSARRGRRAAANR